jgi:hypothetical protein
MLSASELDAAPHGPDQIPPRAQGQAEQVGRGSSSQDTQVQSPSPCSPPFAITTSPLVARPLRGAPVASHRAAVGCPARRVVVRSLWRAPHCPGLVLIRTTVPPWTRRSLLCSLHGGTHLLPCTARSQPPDIFLRGTTISGFASGASHLHRGSPPMSHARAHPSPRRSDYPRHLRGL